MLINYDFMRLNLDSLFLCLRFKTDIWFKFNITLVRESAFARTGTRFTLYWSLLKNSKVNHQFFYLYFMSLKESFKFISLFENICNCKPNLSLFKMYEFGQKLTFQCSWNIYLNPTVSIRARTGIKSTNNSVLWYPLYYA